MDDIEWVTSECSGGYKITKEIHEKKSIRLRSYIIFYYLHSLYLIVHESRVLLALRRQMERIYFDQPNEHQEIQSKSDPISHTKHRVVQSTVRILIEMASLW